MRPQTLLFPAIAVLTFAACPSRDAATDSTDAAAQGDAASACVAGGGTPRITAAGVGPLRVGDRVSTLPRGCTTRDTSFTLGEGMTENGRIVNLGTSSAVLMLSDGAEPTIQRVIVADSSIRTEEGLGVGKSVGALRAAYGRVCAMRGEGNVVVAVSALPGVSFQVRGSIPVTADVENRPESIPDNAAIDRIWVHGGRSACGGS